MEFLQARIDSYNKSKRTKQSLARSTSASMKWPHPTSHIATPRTLAEAGFYFDPGPENLDNATCFMCGKQLSDWEPDDDPFELHYIKCSERCAWASVRCGPEVEKRSDGQCVTSATSVSPLTVVGRFHFADSSRVPTSRAMEKARLKTFTKGDGWPHDAVKGHAANSQQVRILSYISTVRRKVRRIRVSLWHTVRLLRAAQQPSRKTAQPVTILLTGYVLYKVPGCGLGSWEAPSC